jgi:hypothetical protein
MQDSDSPSASVTSRDIPAWFFNKHFPKCISCGKPCMYLGDGCPHPEVAICRKCANEELERRERGFD